MAAVCAFGNSSLPNPCPAIIIPPALFPPIPTISLLAALSPTRCGFSANEIYKPLLPAATLFGMYH